MRTGQTGIPCLFFSVSPDPALDKRGHTAMDMEIITRDENQYTYAMDITPGFPGNPLTQADHMLRFKDCFDFGGWTGTDHIDGIPAYIKCIESAKNVCDLISLLLADKDEGVLPLAGMIARMK